jgi:hypothetical protein
MAQAIGTRSTASVATHRYPGQKPEAPLTQKDVAMDKVYKLMQREYVRYSRIWKWRRL